LQATLSHYRILEEIGAGGMGVVYRAHDDRLDRDVALKVLTPGTLSDEAARRHFHKEALTLSKLSHPNIATVFDFDNQEGTDFLVTEFIPGLTLDSMLAAGPLAEKEIVRLGSQLAEGLEAAHQHGVIHRDLKPGNVRVTADARVKILDFGLARIVHGEAGPAAVTESLTETGLVAGTLPYMAPEQLLGSSLDPRTDIWAAGCVLYEMASGRRPFLGSGTALTDAILHQAPAPPVKLNPLLPWALEAVILKCLEKDPENRYQSARELAVDLRRLTSASATVRAAQPTRLRRRTVVIAVALPVLLALAVIAALRFGRGRNASSPPTTAPSIAVLPFVDMSPQKDQEYFADGLAEELLNSLARTPGVRVVARTSSFQFKGKNAKLADIGRELNVATILEGSVRKQANRVRITAQLINASDGFHLWSETYDRELNDIFAVQEEIAQSVAASLKVTLLGGTSPSTRGTSQEAYNAYLQGRYFYQRSSKEGLERAVSYYQRAIDLDPGYARAWVGLAEAHSHQADWGYVLVEDGYPKALAEAERALALDANLAEAHAAVGWIKTTFQWDWAGADAAYKQALALGPGNFEVLYGAAVLALDLGRRQEALALCLRAEELDPLNTQIYIDLARAHYWSGRLPEATAAVTKALEIDPARQYAHTLLAVLETAQSRPQEALAEMEREPDLNWRLFGLALTYHALGRKQESDAALAELIAKFQAVSAFQVAEVYAFRGESDRAFQWLERAYVQRDGGLTWIKGDPLLKSLQRDPRYAAFLKKMRLPAN
jgi:serine/threonine protein kinase/tetratricopeptide (TPR) repeat protein